MCKGDNKFLCALRFFLGSWFLFVGLMKWFGPGPTGFVGYIQSTFANTWAPSGLVGILAWLILIAEPVVGLGLLVRGNRKCPWALGCLLMFMLVIGQTILQNYAVVANNWFYLFMLIIGFGMAEGCCGASKTSCCDSTEKKDGCCEDKKDDHGHGHDHGSCCKG